MLIGIGFAHVDGAAPWFRSGAVLWVAAYFLVIYDNHARRLPLRTRGGIVPREPGSWGDALPFIQWVVFGLGVLLVVLTAR